MRIGVCTTDFENTLPADELFALVKELGFSSVQLAFSSVSECGFRVSEHIAGRGGFWIKDFIGFF